jgi:hypothetical protein
VPRERGGWLKPDALRTAGIGEEYAVEKDDARHEVSLRHDERQGGYVTQHVIIRFADGVREVHAWQVGDDVARARRQFREIVKSLGGKA